MSRASEFQGVQCFYQIKSLLPRHRLCVFGREGGGNTPLARAQGEL